MPRPVPSFPTFDEWRNLSESEQDALLEALEAASQRRPILKRVLFGLLCVAAGAVIGGAVLTTRI